MRAFWMVLGVGCLIFMCVAAFQNDYERATFLAVLATFARISAHGERRTDG